MKLNILERIVAIQTINGTPGNFITLKTLKGLKAKLLVNEEEVKKYNLRIIGDDYKWDELGNTEYVELNLTEGETKLIIDGLIRLDKENTLTENHYSLYEKFIPSNN